MTAGPFSSHPHLWVSYPYAPGEAEICTLCDTFLTPENATEDCPESFPDIEDEPPPEVPAAAEQTEPADGADDEMRQGAIIPP